MVSDRKSSKEHIGTSEIPIDGSKWSLGVTKQPSISGLKNVINTLVANDYNSFLETFIRGVVRDAVERKVQEHQTSRAKVNEGGISGARPLELCFVNNKLPETVFTQSNIIAKDGPPLQIALCDVRSHSIVNDGPFSSMKIEICALKGEFESCGNEDWTEIEFNANILSGRDGKQPLLVGERFITLKNGVACISKIILTDNSRWVRGRKFRLGVKAMQNGENVKEGRSQPFKVKDIRGESYKKHFPPFLNDDIWRLMKIAKQGKFHKRLCSHRIHTVKDLLQLLIVNESSLYEKFGKIQKKSWSAIIEHAKLCVVDDYKLYSYLASGQPIMLIFNSIYKLVAVTFDAQNYYLPDTLTPSLKNLVEIVKQDAYKNVDKFVSIDEALLNSISLEACLKSAVQGPKEIGPGYGQPSTSTSYEGMHNCQIYDDPVPNIRETPQKNNVEGEMYIEGGYLTETLINEYLLNTKWGLENNVLFGFSDGAECSTRFNLINSAMDISSNEKPKAVWCKILVAIKWVISVKRGAAARRNANLFYFNY